MRMPYGHQQWISNQLTSHTADGTLLRDTLFPRVPIVVASTQDTRTPNKEFAQLPTGLFGGSMSPKCTSHWPIQA